MKYFLTFSCALLLSCLSFAQSLTGLWQGHFEPDGLSKSPKTYLTVNIEEGHDGVYNIHSYTRIMQKGTYSIISSKMDYKKTAENTIELKHEGDLIADFDGSVAQTIFLQFKERKGKALLMGTWESVRQTGSMYYKSRGRIILTRKVNI